MNFFDRIKKVLSYLHSKNKHTNEKSQLKAHKLSIDYNSICHKMVNLMKLPTSPSFPFYNYNYYNT